jgi:hypothetical protein
LLVNSWIISQLTKIVTGGNDVELRWNHGAEEIVFTIYASPPEYLCDQCRRVGQFIGEFCWSF